jgi:hypothetical protein
MSASTAAGAPGEQEQARRGPHQRDRGVSGKARGLKTCRTRAGASLSLSGARVTMSSTNRQGRMQLAGCEGPSGADQQATGLKTRHGDASMASGAEGDARDDERRRKGHGHFTAAHTHRHALMRTTRPSTSTLCCRASRFIHSFIRARARAFRLDDSTSAATCRTTRARAPFANSTSNPKAHAPRMRSLMGGMGGAAAASQSPCRPHPAAAAAAALAAAAGRRAALFRRERALGAVRRRPGALGRALGRGAALGRGT